MSFRDSLGDDRVRVLRERSAGGEGQHDGGMKGRDGAAALANPMLAAVAGRAGRARSICGEQSAQDGRHPGASAEGHAEPAAHARGRERHSVARHRQMGDAAGGIRSRLCGGGEEISGPLLLRVVRSEPVDEAGEGRRARAADASIRDEHRGTGVGADDRWPVVREPRSAAERVRDVRARSWKASRARASRCGAISATSTGSTKGLNVVMHFSHVGACTGRDHFSGWSLDWINLAPRLPAVPAPVLCAGRCARGISRRARCGRGVRRAHRGDSARQPAGADEAGIVRAAVERRRAVDGDHAVSAARRAPKSPCSPSARRAISPARRATRRCAKGVAADVYVINGFPLPDGLSSTGCRRATRRSSPSRMV